MRSLPGKTSGCSTIPLATITSSRADLEQQVAVGDGDETLLEEPDRGRGRQDLDAGAAGSIGQLPRANEAVALHQQGAAGLGPFLDDHHRVSAAGRVDRRLETCLPPADHEGVDVAMLHLDALLPCTVRVELPEPGGVPQHFLVQRPQLARADEGLVVEARRGERAAELVRHGHQVVVVASRRRSAA